MIREYGKARGKALGIVAVFLVVEAVIFSLCRISLSVILYVAVVCTFFGAAAAAFDYGRFCAKHRRLQRLREEILVSLDELPQPKGILERDYQELLRDLSAENHRLSEEAQLRMQELVEYYTVWTHQIKTPIAAMRLVLQTGELEEKQELTEELQRIEQYVEMALCYLRLDKTSSDYVIREYDLDAILRQAARKHASAFIRKRIRLNYEPTGARVVTDEKWLFFVIDQIFSNALKYTRSGSITISMEKPKTLCISDTGIGIAPEDLPRIFEKGYTGLTGRADKRASGIGLYLCRRICDNLGHRIFVTSVVGEGTQVRLDLKNAELEVE